VDNLDDVCVTDGRAMRIGIDDRTGVDECAAGGDPVSAG
jgi:hypothetical protein